MNIKEKVAYLQGLAEGIDINSTDEGKLFAAIIDTLDDMADEIDSLNENALDIGEELDALSDDLAEVEDFLEELDTGSNEEFDFDDDDFDEDDYNNWVDLKKAYDNDDGDDGCGFCGGCDDEDFSIDVSCPECNAQIEINEDDIRSEMVTCPVCGKSVELQIDEVDADCGDDGEELPF